MNEIKIDSAYNQLYMDEKMQTYVNIFKTAYNKYNEAKDECDSNIESMDIWFPSPYSTSYARMKFNRAQEHAKQNIQDMEKYTSQLKDVAKDMKTYISTFKSDFMGWGCTVNYRCKTASGMPTLSKGYFVVDPKYKKLLYTVADLEDDDYKATIDIINSVIDGKWDQDNE